MVDSRSIENWQLKIFGFSIGKLSKV